jgi:hypothetical protein
MPGTHHEHIKINYILVKPEMYRKFFRTYKLIQTQAKISLHVRGE